MKTLRIVVETTVADDADPTDIADAIFDGLHAAADARPGAFPSIISFDGTEAQV